MHFKALCSASAGAHAPSSAQGWHGFATPHQSKGTLMPSTGHILRPARVCPKVSSSYSPLASHTHACIGPTASSDTSSLHGCTVSVNTNHVCCTAVAAAAQCCHTARLALAQASSQASRPVHPLGTQPSPVPHCLYDPSMAGPCTQTCATYIHAHTYRVHGLGSCCCYLAPNPAAPTGGHTSNQSSRGSTDGALAAVHQVRAQQQT